MDLVKEDSCRGTSKSVIKNYSEGLRISYVETSSLTGDNVDELFDKIIKDLIKKSSNLIKEIMYVHDTIDRRNFNFGSFNKQINSFSNRNSGDSNNHNHNNNSNRSSFFQFTNCCVLQ